MQNKLYFLVLKPANLNINTDESFDSTNWNIFICMYTVQDKLRFDPESEIATTGLRVSLICPVSVLFLSFMWTLSCGTTDGSNKCLFNAAGKDETWSAMSSAHLRPPAVFRCCLLPANEWKETHMDLPRMRQACALWASNYWWVGTVT